MYIYIYICIYTYMYTHIYTYIYTHICTYRYIHIYAYMHIYIHTCTYVYIYKNIHIYEHMYLPDPINDLSSLHDCQIAGNCFTYRSVQIYKILCRGTDAPEFDPPHKIMRYWFYCSPRSALSSPPEQNGRNFLYQ